MHTVDDLWQRAARGLLALVVLLLTTLPALSAEPVRTADLPGRRLDAPAPVEQFTFAVFGDRAPGASNGIEVVQRAVETANHLGVRFVLTTGNMVQGDTDSATWAQRANAYLGAMSRLGSPWYPVPGPLDTAIRAVPIEHAREAYRREFGPMSYSFDSGWVHVVVLAAELLAADDPGRAAQLRWLEADLRATNAEQVFVVLHQPLWRDGSAWDAVHEILRADGRPTRVLSGGTRYARDDGTRNNVQYASVPMTGAFASGTHAYASMHAITLVHVTRHGHRVTFLPYDAADRGDRFTGDDAEAIHALVQTGWATVEGFVQAGREHGDGAGFEVVLENPAVRRFQFDIETVAPDGWVLSRDRITGQIDPGQTLRLPISAESPPLNGIRPIVEVVVTAAYPVGHDDVQSVIRRVPVPVRPRGAEELAGPTPGDNGVLALAGDGAVRVDLGASPWRLTAECWVKGPRSTGHAAILARFADDAGFSLVWSRPGGVLPAGMVGTQAGLARAVLPEPPDFDLWHHLALTYDGRIARLFLDGKPVAESEASSDLIHPDAPLYIGAEPNRRGDPVSFFTGLIDEVRVSSVVRYAAPFTPARVFEPDEHTLLLLHFDTPLLGAHPDHSGRGNHGWQTGSAEILRDPR